MLSLEGVIGIRTTQMNMKIVLKKAAGLVMVSLPRNLEGENAILALKILRNPRLAAQTCTHLLSTNIDALLLE